MALVVTVFICIFYQFCLLLYQSRILQISSKTSNPSAVVDM